MMFMNEAGLPAEAPPTPLVVDAATARRWQDATMATFAGKGLSAREVGLLLNLDKSTVCRRLKAMPAEARAHFASSPRE